MLPLLETLDALWPSTITLDGWGCIYVQHILRSNCDCAEFLVKRGVSKGRLHIFGKAYSTSEVALEYYRKQSFAAQNIGTGYGYSEPFDDALIVAVTAEIKAIIAGGVQKLLLIDEGGIAIQAASAIPEIKGIQVAVAELTARGAHHYHLLQDYAPIVDVARSDAKKRVEAPLIAESMAELLAARVEKVIGKSLAGLRIGMVGVGAVGGALERRLQAMGGSTRAFDVLQDRSSERSLSALLSSAELITSSTGQGMDWGPLLPSLPPNVLLANCGSSDIEFQPWRLRAQLPEDGFLIGSPESPWTDNISIITPSSRATILSGGFPVNFDGSPDPIDASKIQLTRAILMAGAIQATLSESAGVHDLRPDLQHELVARFNELRERQAGG